MAQETNMQYSLIEWRETKGSMSVRRHSVSRKIGLLVGFGLLATAACSSSGAGGGSSSSPFLVVVSAGTSAQGSAADTGQITVMAAKAAL
jgi:hypothetical protein